MQWACKHHQSSRAQGAWGLCFVARLGGDIQHTFLHLSARCSGSGTSPMLARQVLRIPETLAECMPHAYRSKGAHQKSTPALPAMPCTPFAMPPGNSRSSLLTTSSSPALAGLGHSESIPCDNLQSLVGTPQDCTQEFRYYICLAWLNALCL